MQLPIIEKRKCKMCDCEFEITAQQKNKRYCDQCRKKHQLQYQAEYRKGESKEKQKANMKDWYRKHHKEEFHFNVCCLCGKKFLTKQGVSKYCIPCVEEAAEKDRYFRTILERRVI